MVGISIVIPSLNSGAFIGEAIASALQQDYESLELVIQDGGSSDNTHDIVESFSDPRLSFASEPDRGQTDAINKAIARSTGDWVLWLNADDRLAPGALGSVRPYLTSETNLIYGNFDVIDSDGKVLKRYRTPHFSFSRILRRGAYIFSGSMLVRRDLVDEAGGLDFRLRYCMDYDFLLRAAKGARPAYVPVVIGQLREHGMSKSKANVWGFWKERWIVARRHGLDVRTAAWQQLRMAAYILSRPLWSSRAWRRLRPAKEL